MTNQFDALNNLTSADEEDIKEQIEKYFNEMDLDEPEKEKRIGLATDIEKGFRNLFILMLTAQIIGESLESRRDDFVDFAYHDYTDAMIENGYSTDEYYTGQGYVEQYAKRRCEEIVDTAILHKADNYYFSTDHSIAIGEDETNAVGNYQREQMAIAQGYTMKTWVTFQDDKVRHSHRLLQGQTINIFKPFEVGTGLMMFPLDVSLGVNKKEVYNCRCICEYSGKRRDISENFISDETIISGMAAAYTSEILDENKAKNEARIEGLYQKEYYENDYDTDDISAGLRKSEIGKESVNYIEKNNTLIYLDSISHKGISRGDSLRNSNAMTIYFQNIVDNMDAQKTIVHEATHLRFDIGMSQHAEAICYAYEKMHELNRTYLTKAEWEDIVEKVKAEYTNLKWEEGGYGDFTRFVFVQE